MTLLTQKAMGVRVRAAREAMGLSLTAAEAASGIPYVVLGSYERGDRNPTVEKAAEWAAAFGLRLVLLGPDQHVVSTQSAAQEQWVSFVVVYGPNGDGTIECDTEAEAEMLAGHIAGGRAGYRVNRRGTITFGREPT